MSLQLSRRLVASFLIVFLLAALTLYQPSQPDLWLQTFYNWLHFPLFATVTAALYLAAPRHWHTAYRLAFTIAVIALLGVGTEALQIPIAAKNASIGDLVNDLSGAATFVGLAIGAGWMFSASRPFRILCLAVSVGLFTWSILPLADITLGYLERYRQAPSIAPLNSRTSRLFFNLENAIVHYVDVPGEQRVNAEFQSGADGSWSVDFHDPWPDWRGYESLVIDIGNPGAEQMCMVVRVHDRAHLRGEQPGSDRFRREFCIPPGRQRLTFPLSDIASAPVDREMDLRRIDGLILYRATRTSGRRFVLYDIRLE